MSDKTNGKKSTNGSKASRDASGRFVKGGAGISPGRPPLAAELPYIDGLKAAVTAERVATVLDRLFEDAIKGNVNAAKIFLSYAVGNPAVKVELDANVYNQNATTIYLPMLPELEGEGGNSDD
jgi:hypothetical protein